MKKFLTSLGRQWPLVLLSSVSLLAYAALAGMDWRYGTLRAAYTPQSIIWFGLAFFAYLGLLIWSEKRGISKHWMWGGALLFRIILLFTTPTLSDDVYRYLWDGYVANEGVSPYAYAINAPELDYLDIPQRAMANNAWMASPYLPAAQAVFFGVTAVFPLQPFYLQLAMVICELYAAWILARLLALAFLPPQRLLIYLWNPLVIVEVAHGAHIDAWMLLLALLAVYYALKQAEENSQQSTANHQRRTTSAEQVTTGGLFLGVDYLWVLSPLFLGLATLTKILPVLLLPVLFWFWNWRQRIFFGLLVVIMLLPFGLQAGWGLLGEKDGTGLFGALRIYSSQWRFNSGIFHWLEVGVGKQGFNDPAVIAKGVIGLLFLLLITAVWLLARKQKRPRAALRLMSLPLMGYTLLTPTLHPWYILILLAFLPFLTPATGESPWLWLLVAPWLYLSGALIFSYLTYIDPLNFGELEWVRQLEWLPVFILLLVTAVIFTGLCIQERRKEDEVPPGLY
jgi:hypothetical protein